MTDTKITEPIFNTLLPRKVPCPKCHGNGTQLRPPHLPAEVSVWTDSNVRVYPCVVCNGIGTVDGLELERGLWLSGGLNSDWSIKMKRNKHDPCNFCGKTIRGKRRLLEMTKWEEWDGRSYLYQGDFEWDYYSICFSCSKKIRKTLQKMKGK